MTETVLVLNVGSSSIKFAVFAAGDTKADAVLSGQVAGIGTDPVLRHTGASAAGDAFGAISRDETQDVLTERLLGWLSSRNALGRIAAVGHRVVHGGTRFAGPVRIEGDVLDALAALEPLAPLHQPFNVAAIRAVARRFPDLPQVACFDTAFHQSQPAVAQEFALPAAMTERGIRRYGFHGLSYEHIAHVLPAYLGDLADGRVIVAHLGNGASLCAMHTRRCVATTMGFTALDGLVMAERSGALDPGVILYMQQEMGMSVGEVEEILYRRSGLLGVSGLSGDMRVLEASRDPGAAHAIELFCYRAVTAMGGLAAALGGLDAVVFTAGIGENSAGIRARICRGLAWLGVDLDPEANAAHGPDIGRVGAACGAWVIPTDEERVIARATAGVALEAPPAASH